MILINHNIIGGTISFERETYTVKEDNGFVEMCIVSFNLTGIVEVQITSPNSKEVNYPAFGMITLYCCNKNQCLLFG